MSSQWSPTSQHHMQLPQSTAQMNAQHKRDNFIYTQKIRDVLAQEGKWFKRRIKEANSCEPPKMLSWDPSPESFMIVHTQHHMIIRMIQPLIMQINTNDHQRPCSVKHQIICNWRSLLDKRSDDFKKEVHLNFLKSRLFHPDNWEHSHIIIRTNILLMQ